MDQETEAKEVVERINQDAGQNREPPPRLAEMVVRATQMQKALATTMAAGAYLDLDLQKKALAAVVAALPRHLPNGWGGEGQPAWEDLTDEEKAIEYFRGWLTLSGARMARFMEVHVGELRMTFGQKSLLAIETS